MPVNDSDFIGQLKIALKTHKFQRLRYIQGMASISGLYGKSRRCGIYALVFANEEVYIGQAKNVTQRYVQHRKNHTDIAYIAFKPTAIKRLNETERSVIGDLEFQGFDLRNITFTSIPKGVSDFELIMPRAQQDAWLADFRSQNPPTQRAEYEDLRRKYVKNYTYFSERKYADSIVSVLREYARYCLPIPGDSEVSFWSCSCGTYATVHARINVNWQEVFNAQIIDQQLVYVFFMCDSTLTEAYDDDVDKMFERHPYMLHESHKYHPGGSDQVCLSTVGQEETLMFLDDPAVREAIKLFNLRLMNKGPCNSGRTHCVDLADKILEP